MWPGSSLTFYLSSQSTDPKESLWWSRCLLLGPQSLLILLCSRPVSIGDFLENNPHGRGTLGLRVPTVTSFIYKSCIYQG